MILIKNKLLIMVLLCSFVLPLGGFGIKANSNLISREGSSMENNFNLAYESTNTTEGGLGIFFYIDALPSGLAVEYSYELLNVQSLDMNISLDSESYLTEFVSFKQSQYFTIRKNWKSLSVPFLAKMAINYGIGYNTHKLIVPSVSLLKDITNTNNIDDLFNQSNQDFSTSDINGLLSDYGLDANGIHFQIGGQAKLLFFNIFTSMRYTFLFETNNSNMKSFPSLTVSAAYGI